MLQVFFVLKLVRQHDQTSCNYFIGIQGTTLKNGVEVCAALKTPFSCPPCSLRTRSPFHIFSVLKTLLSPQSCNVLEILSSRASKLMQSSVQKPRNEPKLSSQNYIFFKEIQFTRVQKLGSGPLTSPSVHPFGRVPISKWKLSALPGEPLLKHIAMVSG